MTDINAVSFTGRIVKDAESREFHDGSGVVSFTAAVNRSVKKDGQWTEAASFIDVKYYTKGFAAVTGYLLKGIPVAVSGSIEQETWEKDGKKQSRIVINARNVRWFSPAPSSQQSSQKQSYGNQPSQNESFPEDYPF